MAKRCKLKTTTKTAISWEKEYPQHYIYSSPPEIAILKKLLKEKEKK